MSSFWSVFTWNENHCAYYTYVVPSDSRENAIYAVTSRYPDERVVQVEELATLAFGGVACVSCKIMAK